MSRYLAALAPGLRLVGVALDDLDRSGNRNLPRVAGLEERVANPERNLRLIDLDDAFEKFSVRIDHRAPQFLRQQPGRLVGDAELGLQLQRRHAVGVRRHQMRGLKPRRQRQPRAVHHGAGGERGLASAIQTFKQAWTTFERSGAALAASGTNEAVGPATLEQEGGATRLVGERFLKLGERTAPRHALVSSQSRACSRTAQTQHIAEPQVKGISLLRNNI